MPDGKILPIPPNSPAIGKAALREKGPVVPVSVCLEANMAKPLLSQGKSIVSHGGYALIDTGAKMSCIDEELAKTIGLPVVNKGKMTSASHEEHPCNFYPVQITIGGQIVLQIPNAMGATLKGQGLIALIGRDVLENCTMIYNGGMGTITLAL